MLTARVVKLPKAQPAVNNFFPLFAFFFPGDLLAARSENLGETRSAVNDFFSPREKNFVRPCAVTARSALVKAARRSHSVSARRELRLCTSAPKRSSVFYVVRLFAGSPRPFRVVRVVRGRARAREKAAPRQARTVDAATRSRFSGGLPTAGLRRLRPCEYAPEAALSSGKTPAPFSKRDRHAIPASVEGGESTACCRPTPV